MRALWLQLRVSIARWGAVPLAVLGMAVLLGRHTFWVGIWPETGAAAQVSAFFLSIFGAGIAAWVAARIEVRGLREQAAAAAIRPLAIELARFTAVLLWLIVPYLLVAATAFTATAVTLFAPGVVSFFEYVLLGAVIIALGTVWGWLIGRLLAPLVAAVCAALSWFLVASLLQPTDVAVMSGPPWLEIELGQVALRVAAVLLFAAAVCAIGWRQGQPRRFARQVVVALVALLGVLAAHLTTTAVSHRAPVATPLCVQGTIEYCLWPEHAKYVPMVEAVDDRVAALPVELALPDRVVDYALSGSTRWIDRNHAVALEGDFAPEFDISEGSRWALARGVASAIAGEVFAECEPGAPQDPERRRHQLFSWLEWRLAGGGTPDYHTDAPAELQAAWEVGHESAGGLSEREQAAWASDLIAEKKEHHCRAA